MESIIILLIILVGSLLLYNLIFNVIEPLTCAESGKTTAKLSTIDKSVDNFKSDINSKLQGIDISMKLSSSLISSNSKATENNKSELKKLTKKITEKMKGQGDKMDNIKLPK